MISYVRAEFEDIDILESIERKCFKDPWNAEMLFAELLTSHSNFFLVYVNNQVIGYFSYLHIIDELHIMNIAVLPEHRRKEYGTHIVERIIDDAVHLCAKAITLEVRESNEAAIGLYEKIGFVCSGTRPRYYMDKENALIYWLEL